MTARPRIQGVFAIMLLLLHGACGRGEDDGAAPAPDLSPERVTAPGVPMP